ncbi:aminotransferase V [Sphingobacterium sp. Ka21]|uniref:Aminotransferase V n=2 Tax=Sphingobacterium pedocola TaxID=2082722 RepID=A0ABR9T319_9SPHI|nr:aminotransferase V [Sphingobacterium pedocola]
MQMDYNEHFDVPENIIYLNTPGNGLMPKSHHIWRQHRDAAFFAPSGMLREQQGEFITEVKKDIAELFHCSTDRTFCVPNFSFGFNTLIEGFSADTSFALISEDYPSLNYPIISRGFPHFYIEANENLEENIFNAVTENKPNVLLLSIVQYITGLKVNLDFIKKLKVAFPDLIIIGDATQFLGTEPFDFDNSGFDAVGTSGYKWMMAGFGNGFLMISKDLASKIYEDAQSRPRPQEGMWAKKSILDTYFEPGHQDTLSHGTLQQSIRFLKGIGLENIQQHIHRLSMLAYDELTSRDLILPFIKTKEIKSSLINIQIPQDFYPALLADGLKCFPRGTGIRIGIHLYNNEIDIEKLIQLIDKHTWNSK